MKKIIFLFALLCPSYIWAQWNSNPSINTAVCVTTADQSTPDICADEVGGAFIVWDDRRNGSTNTDIYMQHLDSTGTALWTTNGIPVCTAASHQGGAKTIADGAGGCFIFWQDARLGTSNPKLYAQHISAAGTMLWATDGIELPYLPGSSSFRVISDNNGGAVFCWTVNGTGTDVVAQRMDSNGNPLWPGSSLLVCNATGNQTPFGLIAEADGATVVAWVDLRNGNTDLYAQRIGATGSTLWTSNGVSICQESHGQNVAEIIPSQNKGVIVSWQDERISMSQLRTYAQHLDSSGNKLWPIDGLQLGTTHNNIPVLATDNAGGAIVAWYDSRNFTNIIQRNNDIYAQRVNAAGVAQWTSGGQMICDDSLEQAFPKIISDGSNGAVLVWVEQPEGVKDIRAQRMDGNGNVVWTSPATVSNTTGNQAGLKMIKSGNKVIITWYENRSGNYDIYAAQLNLIGTNPIPLPVNLISFTGQTRGSYNLLNWITASENNNKGFSIERSNDAVSFREISFVKGSGNTSSETAYQFTDEQPPSGKNFYRLKQMDIDGRIKYGSVVELTNKTGTTSFLYPNPADGTIKVVTEQKEQLYLADIYGRNVLSSFTNQTIDITNLKPGRYYCRFGSTVLSFVKK